MTEQEIKDYVFATIRSGRKDRIKKVLLRYYQVKNFYKRQNSLQMAKEVFSKLPLDTK